MYMKKALSALCLALTLCLAACFKAGGGAEPTAAPKTEPDFDNRFGDGYPNLIETEDAYYYNFLSRYLYYYDKASGINGVLCSRPECTHDSEEYNTSCSGYIDPYLRSINMMDGRLWYCSCDYANRCNAIFSIGLDGTDKRVECDIEGYDVLGYGTPQRLDHHRGKLYGYSIYQRVTEAVPEKGLSILCIDPKTGDAQVLYDLRGSYLWVSFYYYEQYVYCCYYEYHGKAGSDVHILRWDTDTLERETVFEESGVDGGQFSIKVVSEEKIMLVPNVLPEGSPQVVFCILNGKLTKAFEFDSLGIAYAIEGGDLCYDRDREQMEILKNDGSLVYKGDIGAGFLKELGDGMEINSESAVYGDTNEIFIVYSLKDAEETKAARSSCLVRYDLTMEEPEGELLVFSPWM